MKLRKFFTPQQKNPELWVKILIVVNIVYYLASILVSYVFAGAASIDFFSPASMGLVVMGASGSELVFKYHLIYSLVNANFLHGNLMHIAFNMIALYQLFRPVAWSYGTDRALVIYLASGVFAYFCSALMGIQFTVGASGAIFGLMGALLYFAKSRGDLFGQKLFKEIAVWAVIILVMGFMSEGVNNVAHLTGLISGSFLGWALNFRKREGYKIVAAANICLLITLLCLLYPVLVIMHL